MSPDRHRHFDANPANMPFSHQNFETTVTQATDPEQLRDILVLLFREVAMRYSRNRVERTGFEDLTEEELHLAFYRTANEMIIRWGYLQDQLGNVVVGMRGLWNGPTQSFTGSLVGHNLGNILHLFRSVM